MGTIYQWLSQTTQRYHLKSVVVMILTYFKSIIRCKKQYLVKKKSVRHWSETKAGNFLQHRGLLLLEQNYYCYWGEIDVIMQDGQTIVFIEVRYRSHSISAACLSITQERQQRLQRTAQHYLQAHPVIQQLPCRFDIVALSRQEGQLQIQWIKNAFGANKT